MPNLPSKRPYELNAVKSKLHLSRDNACQTMLLDENLALRVYADTKPHNLEVSRLQKGLVLTLGGKELIEEGIGWGVPVAVFSDKTYFSGSARITVDEGGENIVVTKRFLMNMVSRKGWKKQVLVDNTGYRFFSNWLARAYREYPASRRVTFPLVKLRNKVGIRTLFTKIEPRGKITMTYTMKRSNVYVRADFKELQRSQLKKILLLNEQGSTFFGRFSDSDGSNLTSKQIGPWDMVKAEKACFSNLDGTLGFCLGQVPHSRLFRGMERIRGRLAWAGMGYEVNPNLESFSYILEIIHTH